MYAVQVCMPGKSYDTVRGWGSLSNQFDLYTAIARGTFGDSRKGQTVRLITRANDSLLPYRVIKRTKVA